MIHSRSYSRQHHEYSACLIHTTATVDEQLHLIDISNRGFKLFPSIVISSRFSLEHLVADGNLLCENAFNMPCLPKLKTLSINKNQVRDVSLLLKYLKEKCPSLQYLSLVSNPGWPYNPCSGISKRYLQFRNETRKVLPNLQYLDGIPLKRNGPSWKNTD